MRSRLDVSAFPFFSSLLSPPPRRKEDVQRLDLASEAVRWLPELGFSIPGWQHVMVPMCDVMGRDGSTSWSPCVTSWAGMGARHGPMCDVMGRDGSTSWSPCVTSWAGMGARQNPYV
ncbi:hypothetical protein ACOMHN_052809 [Nucella lapillus]